MSYEITNITPSSATTLARGLGWFSIGLGLSEMLAPRQLSRAIGVPYRNNMLVPLLGARGSCATPRGPALARECQQPRSIG